MELAGSRCLGKELTAHALVAIRRKFQVKRGEIWTIAGGPDYTGKPRPAIILQNDMFPATLSVTVCPLTRTPVSNVHARFTIAPSETNGLRVQSHVMVDKIATMPKSRVRQRIGQLNASETTPLNQRVALFLGLAE